MKIVLGPCAHNGAAKWRRVALCTLLGFGTVCGVVSERAKAAPASTTTTTPTQAIVGEAKVMLGSVIPSRIIAAASTLKNEPPESDKLLLQYAIMSRVERASTGTLSSGTLQVKNKLSSNPGAVFDSLIRLEAGLQDCTGTVVMALYASAVDIAPTYSKFADLIGVKLLNFVKAQAGKDPFPEIRCDADPRNRSNYRNSTLALSLMAMRWEIQRKSGIVISSPKDTEVASKLDQAAVPAFTGLLKANARRG